jgi:hypothetical protein
MTASLREQPAGNSVLDGTAARTLLAVTSLGVGLAVGWLAGGSLVGLGVLAVTLAAGNGYGKAYSP